MTATFPATTARYVRVVQTGTSTSWWSIAELNVYTDGSTGDRRHGHRAAPDRLDRDRVGHRWR